MRICIALLLFGLSITGNASTIIYTSKSSFLSATASGGLLLEDLNAQPAGQIFQNSSIDVGAFTVSVSAPSNSGNYVDGGGGQYSIDGSPHLSVYNWAPDSLFLTFDSSITAFGIDIVGLNSGSIRTGIFVNGVQYTQPGGGYYDQTFFGVVSDTAFTTVEFRGLSAADGYGLDNIYHTQVIPVPAAVWLFGSALAGLGWVRRKKAA